MTKALIITVNYRSAGSTADFLSSFVDLEQSQCARVLVVENDSRDGSDAKLKTLVDAIPNAELLISQVNRGYFGAAKWAFETEVEKSVLPDWVIISNNDITFDDKQFLIKLSQRDPQSCGALAPAIVSLLTGIDSNPFLHKRPTPWQVFRFRFWLSHYYLMAFRQLASPYVRMVRHRLYWWRPKSVPGVKRAIYAPHGAFLILSRRFFESGGFIDDRFFLYAEEFSVAELCRALGLNVVHDPELQVGHDPHQTVGRNLTRAVYTHQRNGLEYVVQNYFRESRPGSSPQVLP